MNKPTFENKVSLGAALQVATMLITVGALWATMEVRISGLQEQRRIDREQRVQMEARLRAAENELGRVATRNEERNAAILTTLGRIEARLERMEGGR